MRLSQAANSTIDHLTAFPRDAKPTLDQRDLRSLLLYTDGWLSVAGHMYDIRSKSLGAGIYRVWLELRT